jgi:hypothetical protein
METKKRSLFVNALIYGLILGAVYIVLSLVYYILDVDIIKPGMSLLILVINIALLIIMMLIATNAYRDKMLGGKITWFEAFLFCVIVGFIAYILSGIYGFLFYKYYEPHLLDQIHMRALEMIEKIPNISESRLAKIEHRMDRQLTPIGTFFQSLQMAVVGSLVFGAIVALFVKKEKEPDENIR